MRQLIPALLLLTLLLPAAAAAQSPVTRAQFGPPCGPARVLSPTMPTALSPM